MKPGLPAEIMCGRPPRARVFGIFWRYGQVQSYVRPLGAVHMTAGPDGVR
jgi:hypothetical protein